MQHAHGRNESCWTTIELLLCEVRTKEEAFAEMRRFLEVNNIPSDCTAISAKEEQTRFGRLIPAHTEVTMWYDGYIDPSNKEYKVVGIIFGLWEDTDRPRHEQLGTPEDHWLEYKEVRNGVFELRTRLANDSGEWYNCAKKYFDDLAIRKTGDEQCH